MHATCGRSVAGIMSLAFATACAGVTDTQTRAAASGTVVAESLAVVPLSVAPPEAKAGPAGTVAVEPVPAEPVIEATIATVPPPAPLPKALLPRTAAEPRRKLAEAVPVEAALDVASLKARLRDTNAIGVFTKLALRNEMDDLLKLFRTQHRSGQTAGIDSLRQPFNMLLLKVLSLVQDGDPSLARVISGSREAIWRLLADPEKFRLAT